MSQDSQFDLKDMIRTLHKQGFTQQAIAVAVNAHQSTINRILSGRYQNTNFSLAMRIQSLFAQYCQ